MKSMYKTGLQIPFLSNTIAHEHAFLCVSLLANVSVPLSSPPALKFFNPNFSKKIFYLFRIPFNDFFSLWHGIPTKSNSQWQDLNEVQKQRDQATLVIGASISMTL